MVPNSSDSALDSIHAGVPLHAADRLLFQLIHPLLGKAHLVGDNLLGKSCHAEPSDLRHGLREAPYEMTGLIRGILPNKACRMVEFLPNEFLNLFKLPIHAFGLPLANAFLLDITDLPACMSRKLALGWIPRLRGKH